MSKKAPKTPYTIGYCRPPAHTRFKPGQSGNPAGRRKGQPSIGDLILREATRLVTVKNAGGIEKITKREALIRQLFNKAMQGDLAAARLILPYIEPAAFTPDEDHTQDETGTLALTAKPDAETVRRILKRFEHLQSPTKEQT